MTRDHYGFRTDIALIGATERHPVPGQSRPACEPTPQASATSDETETVETAGTAPAAAAHTAQGR